MDTNDTPSVKLQSARRRPVEEWLRASIMIEQDACLLFPFKRNSLGYGVFARTVGRENRKYRRAHNFVCELAYGPAPTAAHRALHSCDNPPCVNKRHLRWGLPIDNSEDMIERDRHSRGERVAHAKLTDETVRWIRELVATGRRQKEIVESLGMAKSTISEVVNRKAWRHVK